MSAKRIQDIPGLRQVDEGVYARVVDGKLQIWEDATPDNIRLEPSLEDVMNEGDPVRVSPSRTITVRGGNVEFIDMMDDGKRLHREAEAIKTRERGPSDVAKLVNTLAAAKERPKGDIYAEMRAFKEQVDRVKDERRGVYGAKSGMKQDDVVPRVMLDTTPAEVKAVRKLAREMAEPIKENERPVKKAPVQTLADFVDEDDVNSDRVPYEGMRGVYPLWMKVVFALAVLGGINAIMHIIGWIGVKLDIGVPFLIQWGFVTVCKATMWMLI